MIKTLSIAAATIGAMLFASTEAGAQMYTTPGYVVNGYVNVPVQQYVPPQTYYVPQYIPPQVQSYTQYYVTPGYWH